MMLPNVKWTGRNWNLTLFIVLVLGFAIAYARYWIIPTSGGIPGWAGWYDQSKYYESVQALLRFDFSASHHVFPLGYQLLAALPVLILNHHGYGLLNLALFLITAVGLHKLAKSLLPVSWAAIAIAFIFLYDQQIMLGLVTPWTNNASLAFFALISMVFLRSSWSRRDLVLLGLSAGGVFFCRPGDVVFLVPIYVWIGGVLARERRWRDLQVLTISGLSLPIAYAVVQFAMYGQLVSPYVASAGRFAFHFAGLGQKLFSLFFSGREAFLTDDQMLFARFPWLVFYPVGLAFLAAHRHWRHLVIQASALVGFLYFVSFAPMMPPTLRLFEGMRTLAPFLLLMGLPSLWFLHSSVKESSVRKIVAGVLSLVLVGFGFTGIIGIRQVPEATNVESALGENDVFFQLRASTNSLMGFKQIILPGLISDHLSAAHSDATIRIEDDNGCYTSQLTHLGLSKPYGVAIPLISERASSGLNIAVSRKLVPDTTLVSSPLLGNSEFCFLCGERLALSKQVGETSGDAPPFDLLSLSMAGRRPKVLGNGWSGTEPTHTWTDGKTAKLILPPVKRVEDLHVVFDAASFGRQRVRLAINGGTETEQWFSGLGFEEVHVIFPGRLLRSDGPNVLSLSLPDAQSPPTADKRLLGLALRRLALSLGAPPPRPPTNLSISFAGTRPAEILGMGWSVTEGTHTWTEGRRVELRLPPMLAEDTRLYFEAATPYDVAQRAEVFLNGKKVGALDVIQKGFATYSLDLPATLIESGKQNIVALNLPDAFSPTKLGHADRRVLGLAVKKLRLGGNNGQIDSKLAVAATWIRNANGWLIAVTPKQETQGDPKWRRLVVHMTKPSGEPVTTLRVLMAGRDIATWTVACSGPTARVLVVPVDVPAGEVVLQPLYPGGLEIRGANWEM
jgi:hypothetical protein